MSKVPSTEAPQADCNGAKRSPSKAETAIAILLWFTFNISLGSSTKWLFIHGEICLEAENCRLYKFPLAITVVHMLFSWVMCNVYIVSKHGASWGPRLTLKEQMSKVVPLAACFALSVSQGNLSLKYIYPSFNQMLAAMSPLITVLMAVMFTGRQYNMWTWLSMPVICGGLIFCSKFEVNFNLWGVLFATGATVLRAAKSIMQGSILRSTKMDAVTLLYYMAPFAGGFLLLGSFYSEGFEPFALVFEGLTQERSTGAAYVLVLLFISGLNACLLNIMNFMVTAYTSDVTLQVLGNVKSCLSIAISVAIFRNAFYWIQAFGVVICLFGVWLYDQSLKKKNDGANAKDKGK